MRLPSLAMVAVAAGLSACAPHMVDPQDATERLVAGAAIGGAFGAALGATFSINPVIGAIYGAEAGGSIGGITGVLTAAPVPAYHPIPAPAQAVIPHFYDAWPPGYHAPPNYPETQQRPAG